MKKTILVLLLQSIVSVSPGHQIVKRMVNGKVAGTYQFPYMASLRTLARPLSHRCGAVLIHPHWFLTAGHCLITPSRRYKPQYSVHLGATWRNGIDKVVYNVDKVYRHPDYDKVQQIIRNDLVLLHVAKPIIYTRKIHSVPLGSVEDVDGVPLITAGWGANEYGNDGLARLHYIQMNTTNTKECQYWHAKRGDLVDGKTQICGHSPGKTTCTGDSGGPLVNTQTGRLVGIFSSMQYCETLFPALFVRLSVFKDWIENVTKIHFPFK